MSYLNDVVFFSSIVFSFLVISFYFSRRILDAVERNRLYLEDLIMLVRDGVEASFDVQNSYEVELEKRNDMLDKRRVMLEIELNGVTPTPEVLTSTVESIREKASLDARKLIDDDKVEYAEGVYNIAHSKVDTLDVDEYAN